MEGRKMLKIPKDCLGLKGIKSQNSQGIHGVQGNKIPGLPGIPCDGKESDPKDLLGFLKIPGDCRAVDSQGFPNFSRDFLGICSGNASFRIPGTGRDLDDPEVRISQFLMRQH